MATKPPVTERGPNVTNALAAVARAKEAVVQEIQSDNTSADRINDHVLTLAEQEGALQVAWYEDWEDQQAAREEVVRLVMTGAGDTWSGRGNDVRRARYDGLRKAANRMVR